MFGFRKKEKSTKEQTNKELEVSTMPADFYGGVNPVVKFKDVEKEISSQYSEKKEIPLTKKEKEIFDNQTAKGSGNIWHPANLLTNRRFLILGSLAVFLLFIIGASIYYWSLNRKASMVTEETPMADNSSANNSLATSTFSSSTVIAATTTVFETTSSATSSIASTSIKLLAGETAVEFPTVLLSYGADLDGDKLSDEEEKIFGTDPGIIDTDKDGYSDGQEVFYLYNPNGKEPKRLLDSGKVIEYTNPIFGYKLYYPASWAVGSVDQDYRDVLFSSINGENIEVRVFDLNFGETFADWFGKWASQEKYSELQDFNGVFDQSGKKRSDDLVFYFLDSKQKQVFLLVFHVPTGTITVNFRNIITTMARSLRLSDNTYIKVWPGETVLTTISATTTLVVGASSTSTATSTKVDSAN